MEENTGSRVRSRRRGTSRSWGSTGQDVAIRHPGEPSDKQQGVRGLAPCPSEYEKECGTMFLWPKLTWNYAEKGILGKAVPAQLS